MWGVALSYVVEWGGLIARIDPPRSGNVLLRREQFRRADRPEACSDEALPTLVSSRVMASMASGTIGVVAAWSR